MKTAVAHNLKIWLITALLPSLLIAIVAFLIRLPYNDEPVTDYIYLSITIALFVLAYSAIPFLMIIYTADTVNACRLKGPKYL